MRIGIPKEIKTHEYRVALTPAGVLELTRLGHSVLVEDGAGIGAGFSNGEYADCGADVVAAGSGLFDRAELIVKVKEPQPTERAKLRRGQILFGYLHLAADDALTEDLLRSGVTAIAYETVTGPRGGLPLLAPMSRIAGRLAVQAGAHHLEKPAGGAGVLLGGVPGVAPARVVVLGGGVAGSSAVDAAVGLQAHVTVIDKDMARLEALTDRYANRVQTAYSTGRAIEQLVTPADLVIGSVLVAGAASPKLVTRAMVAGMRSGSVLVDLSIDQGGCFETSRPTTHAVPTYTVDGVVHYCVANVPGAVPRTATLALENATLPYVKMLAEHGWQKALERDPHLANGLNVHDGTLRHPAVAQAFRGEPAQAQRRSGTG